MSREGRGQYSKYGIGRVTSSSRGHYSRGFPPSRQFDRYSAPHAPRQTPRDYPQTHAEQQINLVTNAYSILPQSSNIKIYEYDLLITPTDQCKDLPMKVLSRGFVTRSIRQLIMGTIVPQLTHRSCPVGSVLLEQNLDAIYSRRQFKLQNSNESNIPIEFKFNNLPVVTDLIANLSIDLLIRLRKSSLLNPLGFSPQLLSSIIHHQLLIDMLKYGPVYYMMNDQRRFTNPGQPSDRLDLISQHLMGISISKAKRCADDQALVVISCSHSYITKPYRLIDLLACFIAGKTVDNVVLDHSVAAETSMKIREIATIDGSEEWFASFVTILNGFKCQALDNRGVNVNVRFTLSDQSATDLQFDENTSVQQYYLDRGIRLNYPNLPCLKSRIPNHPYYPLEICSLLPGQKVPIFRLSAQARNHLITVNKPRPSCSRASSLKARDEVNNLDKEQFGSFGIKLSSEPVEATGKTLAKPILQFKTSCIDPQRDYWESGIFQKSIDLVDNWCVVDTFGLDPKSLDNFFSQFCYSASRFGFNIGRPCFMRRAKNDIVEREGSLEDLILECGKLVRGRLRFIMFIIDSSSTKLNRMIHLTFDEHPTITATCLRAENIQNQRLHKSIYRTLVHKLNARLGGTNVVYNEQTWHRSNINGKGLMIVGLDVTHPDNELNGVSIVGCAYTYSEDLFRHRSLVWPQKARVEIINKMDDLMQELLSDYKNENNGQLPTNIIIYRDGVSHEEFERVRSIEISKAISVIEELSVEGNQSKQLKQEKPILSYIIAQKRHTMRFFRVISQNEVHNPPGGTLIYNSVVADNGCEFYLYTNTSPQATARPLHYHVLLNGLGIENLQKLTYYLCFNFAKCSSSLSMPSSLRYAHNAAYDARNRVIASKEFNENRFYTTKFFC